MHFLLYFLGIFSEDILSSFTLFLTYENRVISFGFEMRVVKSKQTPKSLLVTLYWTHTRSGQAKTHAQCVTGKPINNSWTTANLQVCVFYFHKCAKLLIDWMAGSPSWRGGFQSRKLSNVSVKSVFEWQYFGSQRKIVRFRLHLTLDQAQNRTRNTKTKALFGRTIWYVLFTGDELGATYASFSAIYQTRN